MLVVSGEELAENVSADFSVTWRNFKMDQILLGFSGRARHGKTECTLAIKEYAERTHHTVGIYDVGAMILKICHESGRLPATMRREDMVKADIQVLIDVGKEMKNAFGQDYFVNMVVQTALEEHRDVALCPNLRLPIEADVFRKESGIIVRVTRLNADGSLYISQDRDPNDVTETSLSFWPANYYLTNVNNPRGAELLKRQAVALYQYIREEL